MNTATTSDVEEELEEEYAALQAELLPQPHPQRDWAHADGMTVPQPSIAAVQGPDSGIDVKHSTTDVRMTDRFCGDSVQTSGHSAGALQSIRISVESREKLQRNGSDEANLEELARLLVNNSLLEGNVSVESDHRVREGGKNFEGKAGSKEQQSQPLNV